ncbi:MAG TPA: tetratricopeptide repeat protein [Polyangia bacterium]|nr:tetratricopeptide repeat protein [Polyangia bacterium]
MGLLAVARVAAAAAPPGDPAAVAKVTNLNRKALEAYGKQDYDAAKELLKQALDVCADAGLDQHPITARTHIHFGVVAIVGFNQHEVGIKQFRKAIEIEPDIKLTKSLVTPELQDAFEEAVLASNGTGGGAPAAGGDDNGGGAAGDNNAGGGEAAPSGDSDETPPPRRAVKPRRKHSDDDDDNGKDKDDDDAGSGQKGTFFLGLSLGSGFGIAKGSGEVDPAAHNLAAAGFAFSQLGQIKPEIGYFATPTVLLSVALRFQYINGLNGEVNSGCPNGFCKPYSTATSVLARLTYLASDGPLHLTVGGQIGGGYIRHAEVFNSDKNCAPSAPAASDTSRQGCVDTIAGGPFLIGPTAGVMYEIGDSFNLIGGINTELGLSKFTFNIDIDVGIGLRL